MSELVTLEQLAGFLKQGFTAEDAYTAQLVLDGAEEAVREYCGWHIAPSRTETVTVNGSGSPILPLPTLHLTALNELTEVESVWDVDSLDWSSDGLVEKQSGDWWTSRRRGVVTEIEHGFAIAPKWLVTLICAVAGRAFRAPVGAAAESAGGESVTWAQPVAGAAGAVLLLGPEQRMLDRLRVPGSP